MTPIQEVGETPNFHGVTSALQPATPRLQSVTPCHQTETARPSTVHALICEQDHGHVESRSISASSPCRIYRKSTGFDLVRAQRMRLEGVTYREIGAAMGIADYQVRRLVVPKGQQSDGRNQRKPRRKPPSREFRRLVAVAATRLHAVSQGRT